jgi:hypothetical protein
VTYRRYRRYFKKATQKKLIATTFFCCCSTTAQKIFTHSDCQIVVVDFAAAIEYGTPVAITTFPKKAAPTMQELSVHFKNQKIYSNNSKVTGTFKKQVD